MCELTASENTDDEHGQNTQSLTSLQQSFDTNRRSVENVFLTYNQRTPSKIRSLKFKQAIESLLASTNSTLRNASNKQFLETITSLPEINDQNRSP